MLTTIPDNSLAYATRQIRDVTEAEPIPRGARVLVEDFDPCGPLFVVEWEGRIYLAEPEELKP